MKKEYNILVIYDISNDKIRNKIFHILSGYGHNIQKSSFLCLLNNRLYKKMLFDLSKINPAQAFSNSWSSASDEGSFKFVPIGRHSV